LVYGFPGWFCGQNARAQTDGSQIEERERGGHTDDRARERGGSAKRLSVLGAHPQDQRPPTTRAGLGDS
jgi:hypothetical protein